MFYKKESSRQKESLPLFYFVRSGAVAILMFLLSAVAVFAQTETVAQKDPVKTGIQSNEKQTVLQPALSELRGIKIGMTADEVKDKLGRAKVEDASGLYYVFSDGESMQVGVGADKKVNMIATMYVGEDARAPKYEDVFGANAVVEKQPNGRIYNLVRYPEAGYWIAYDSIKLEKDPMVTVTIQKMAQTMNPNANKQQ